MTTPPGSAGASGSSGATRATAQDEARQTAGTAANQARHAAGTAADEARRTAGTAAEQARSVAGTAKEEASNVASEVTHQARDLLSEVGSQLSEQSRSQVGRMATMLREMGDELDNMAECGGGQGMATELVRQIASRTRDAGSHLEGHEPSELLDQLRTTARRRPGTFLLGAAAAGMLVGRLTKATRESHEDQQSQTADLRPYDTGYGASASYPATSGYPAETAPTVGAEVAGAPTTDVPATGVPATGTSGATAPRTPVSGGYAPGGDVRPPASGGAQ
jgi:hypothetical protein